MGKILVADDSSTIQKVVRITLANEQHQLVECMSEDELFVLLRTHVFDLILLDYNLSSSQSGQQLVEKVKEQTSAPIMAMLGTFDSVDPAEIARAGYSESIVKPFESEVFISKCRKLIERAAQPAPAPKKNILPPVMEELSIPSKDFDLDSWTVESSSALPPRMDDAAASIDLEPKSKGKSSGLTQQLEDWGIEIPSIIGSAAEEVLLPPVMGAADPLDHFDMVSTDALAIDHQQDEGRHLDLDSTSSFDIHEFEARFNQALPKDNDLAYPDNSNVEEMDMSEEDDPFAGMNVEMISLDDLDQDDEVEELTFEQTDPHHQVDSAALTIEKELEIEASDDLWAVDEIIPSASPVVETYGGIEHNADYIEHIEFEAQDFAAGSQSTSKNQATSFPFSIDELAEKLRESLAPMIETVIRQECLRIADQVAEKVAWEVIPDLAENIIRKEIKALTDAVE